MLLLFVLLCFHVVSNTTYFRENFYGDKWRDRWVRSTAVDETDYYGRFRVGLPRWYGSDPQDRAFITVDHARHYVVAAPFREEFNTDGKDLVIQYSVKFEADLVDCVGAYLKFGDSDDLSDLSKLDGNTKFSLMFGPDKCGTNEKVHFLVRYKEKMYEWKRSVNVPNDLYTHTYTLWIKKNNKYEIYVDGKKQMQGDLDEHFELPYVPKKVKDKGGKKPKDWVNNKYIPDPSDIKPEEWDDRKYIPKPGSSKPVNWDDATMGDWKPKMVANPNFQGTWKQKMILNPEYKGKWKSKKKANPKYAEDKKYYKRTLSWLGLEVWSMKTGTVFDNFLVTDDFAAAKAQIVEIEKRKVREKELQEELKKKENDRLSNEREKNLSRQRIEREIKEANKPDEEKRKRENEKRDLERKKKAAEKERIEREKAKGEYVDDSTVEFDKSDKKRKSEDETPDL